MYVRHPSHVPGGCTARAVSATIPQAGGRGASRPDTARPTLVAVGMPIIPPFPRLPSHPGLESSESGLHGGRHLRQGQAVQGQVCDARPLGLAQHGPEVANLLPAQQGVDRARRAGARGAPRPVHVGFGVHGRVIVDHGGHPRHVHPARQRVGADQDPRPACAEGLQRQPAPVGAQRARVLHAAPACHPLAQRGQQALQACGGLQGGGEDDGGRIGAQRAQQGSQRLGLALRRHHVPELLQAGGERVALGLSGHGEEARRVQAQLEQLGGVLGQRGRGHDLDHTTRGPRAQGRGQPALV